jgi:hypothetical protein
MSGRRKRAICRTKASACQTACRARCTVHERGNQVKTNSETENGCRTGNNIQSSPKQQANKRPSGEANEEFRAVFYDSRLLEKTPTITASVWRSGLFVPWLLLENYHRNRTEEEEKNKKIYRCVKWRQRNRASSGCPGPTSMPRSLPATVGRAAQLAWGAELRFFFFLKKMFSSETLKWISSSWKQFDLFFKPFLNATLLRFFGGQMRQRRK